MTYTELARRACKLYASDLVPASTNKHNRRQWLKSVNQLGDKWLLAKPVKKGVNHG